MAVPSEGGFACRTAPVLHFEIVGIEGIDPWAGWHRLEGHVPFTDLRESSVSWDTALMAGRRALAHELTGLARAMLRLAVDHATERKQFGRPVGAFQAVQHRLADVQVALACAEVAVEEAWDDPQLWTATMAKLLAGAAARTAAKECQQVCGGMGFTWEHPLHRFVRRAIQLDWLLGSRLELEGEVGRELLSRRAVPPP